MSQNALSNNVPIVVVASVIALAMSPLFGIWSLLAIGVGLLAADAATKKLDGGR